MKAQAFDSRLCELELKDSYLEPEFSTSLVDNCNPAVTQSPILLNCKIKRLHFQKNDPIFFAGDKLSCIYFVNFGFIKAEFSFKNGHHHIHRFMIPGDWFGLRAIGRGFYDSNTTALTDCELIAVDGKDLIEHIKNDNVIHLHFLALHSEIFNQSDSLCIVLGSYSMERKLAYFLIDFQRRLEQVGQDKPWIHLPMSREDLTNHLGMNNASLSRAFSALEELGYFKVQNRIISDINFMALKELIDYE